MKSAGRWVNIFWSWFNSFKTDLETYIYITLQKTVYDLNSAWSAAALVNLSADPSLRTSYRNQRVSRATQEEDKGWTWVTLLCPSAEAPPPPPRFSRAVVHSALPKSTWKEMKAQINSLTHAEFLTHKEREEEREGEGRKKATRGKKEVRDVYFYKSRWRVKLRMGE